MFEKMFEMLEEEARGLCIQIVEKSEGEANRIVEEAEQEAKKIVQAHIDKMDVALRGEAARIQIEAELEKKRKIIHVKEESTAKVYTGAENILKDLRGNKEEYKKIVKNLLLESLNKVRGNKIQVVVDKRDQELLLGILRELNLNHEVTAGNDSIGGISLYVDGSRILVYNTLESRLEKAKQILKAQLNEVLFGDRQTADSIG